VHIYYGSVYAAVLVLQPCHRNPPPRSSSIKQTRKPTLLAAGSPHRIPSLKKQEIYTSKRPIHSNSRSNSEKLATHLPEKRNAERNATSQWMLAMLGGTPQRPTRGDTLIVSHRSMDQRHRRRSLSPAVAVQALTQTITHLTKAGRFRQAADREKEIGQIYLHELHDLRKACESFERAAEWYANEDATA
jgi:Soluble NSF attachment protein, SNAP